MYSTIYYGRAVCSKLAGTFKKWLNPRAPQFSAEDELVAGLRRADTGAIEYLLSKTEGLVRNMVRRTGRPPALATDLLHDGLLRLIEKISDGTFNPALASPQTYLVGICRKLLANHLRGKKQPCPDPFTNELNIVGDDWHDVQDQKDRLELLDQLLDQLGPPGSDLIRLKYLEGYSDEEQIKHGMTPYTSFDSLKTSRSYYMKKLALIGQHWREKQDR